MKPPRVIIYSKKFNTGVQYEIEHIGGEWEVHEPFDNPDTIFKEAKEWVERTHRENNNQYEVSTGIESVETQFGSQTHIWGQSTPLPEINLAEQRLIDSIEDCTDLLELAKFKEQASLSPELMKRYTEQLKKITK